MVFNLAFEPHNEKMQNTLRKMNSKEKKGSVDTKSDSKEVKAVFSLPQQPDKPKKKPYSYTLYEQTHDKLNRLARKHGYRSTSSFLDDLIDSLPE